MNRSITTTMLMTLALTACEGSEDQPDASQRLRATEGELEDAACPDYRQIARLDPSAPACPAVQGWTTTPLFPLATDELAEYCQYRWNGDPDDVDFTLLEASDDLLGFAPDCEVVLPQTTDAIWDLVGADVEALFHHGIGLPTATDLDLPGSESWRSPVLVAVIDSVPEPAPVVPRSEHGELMVSLIDDIACPNTGAPCQVSIKRSLGLPRIGGGHVDLNRGGYVGSQGDAARAIYTTVQSWKNKNWGGQTPNLVLNLSIGWDGEIFGDTDDPDMRPPVDAVFTALEYAACHGALIVAAAGNEGDLCTTGPLLPGGWEPYPAPTATRCAELGAPNPPSGPGYKPLLYSVGGLTHDGEPMPGSRVDGLPRLAALATHAIAGGDSTALTGTSVSSAVAAGAAALIWSYRPGLTPSAVMTALYASGDPIGLLADYNAPGISATGVRALDICAALEFACDIPGSSCPFAKPLACLNRPAPVEIADITDVLAMLTLPPNHDINPSFGAEIQCPDECGEPAVGRLATGVGGSPCPDPIDQVLPYTEPQPTQIGCANCTLDIPAAMIHATLDPAFEYANVLEVSVALYDGTRTVHLGLGAPPLEVAQVTRIRLDPSLMQSVESAEISIMFDTVSVPVVDRLLIGR